MKYNYNTSKCGNHAQFIAIQIPKPKLAFQASIPELKTDCTMEYGQRYRLSKIVKEIKLLIEGGRGDSPLYTS